MSGFTLKNLKSDVEDSAAKFGDEVIELQPFDALRVAPS